MQGDEQQIIRLIADLQRGLSSGPPAGPPRPPVSGGSGGFGPLEPRVAALEIHLEHLRADVGKLTDVPVKLGVLDERVRHLPSKGWMVGALLSSLGVITALIAFSEKLHALLH